MAGEPLFDFELLGYRNDLARERVLALLRRLPETAHLAAIERDTPLPLRLTAELPHAQGLRLLGALRDSGAHVRLVAAAAGPPPVEPRQPLPPSRELSRMALAVPLLGVLAVGVVHLLPPRPAMPPSPLAPQPLDAAAGDGGSSHRLNDQAVELNAAGRFSAAADRLREALAGAPAELALRRNLRTVLQNWAVAELNADQPANAVPLLEEALALDEDAIVLGTLGIAHVRQGDYRSGRELLERATAAGVADPASLTALATAYRQLGERAAAVEMLHRARDAGARGSDFDAMVARAEREMDAEWDYDETRSAHFTIGYAGEHDGIAAADLVAHGLEQAYFHVGAKLDLYPGERVPVVLYPSEDFHDVTQTPSWSAGVYDGRIKLPAGGLMASDEDVLERTLRHEYGHVLVHELSRGRAPVWLNEGVAIWAEEERDGDRVEWAERTIAGQPLFHLAELEGAFTRLPADRVHTAYAQSYLAVRALVDRHGARRVRTLLEAIGRGATFDRAYRDALYGDPAAFEAELIRDLTS